MIRALLLIAALVGVAVITAQLLRVDRAERIEEQRRNERLRELYNRRAGDERR